MTVYFAQDGNYGDASGLIIIDDFDLDATQADQLEAIGEVSDAERYAWALRVVTGGK